MKHYITIFLTALVLLTQPETGGKRDIGKLVGKELSTMKHIQPRKAGDLFISAG